MTSDEFVGINAAQTKKIILSLMNIRLGTVTNTAPDGAPIVLIDGETVPSGKGYRRLAWYNPAVGDRVILQKISGVYVVYGKVV